MSRSEKDQRLREKIHGLLSQSCYAQLRSLSCECEGGAVTLTGRVPTFYLKQVAQQLVMALPELQQLHNHLEVEDDNSRPQPKDLN
jgi:osmotically-inducible protein OsmY